jgi:cysteine-rich repeat protein
MRLVISLAAVVLGVGTAAAAPCPSIDLTALRAAVEDACPCAEAASAGAYKKCVKDKLKADGVKGSCKKAMQQTAAKSVCGKSGFVVCCQAGKKGKVVKTAKCKKGTVCQAVPNPDFGVFPLSGSDCSAAGSCPTSSTTTTSTTTTSTSNVPDTSTTTCVSPPTTTSTTEPNLCVGGIPNGMDETGEQCDDDNVDPTDGCTAACTTCSNGTITPPETCDDSNLVSGDGCDANCRTTGCGNGLIFGTETCDDGNTSDNDSCPSDCIVDACTPVVASDRTVAVNFAGGANVGAITILLDYPDGKVSLPGSAGAIPDGILTDYPDGSFPGPNDYDHAFFHFLLGPTGAPLTEGRLFNIHFENCTGAPAPVNGDFTCTVLAAADPNGDPIEACGITCSAVVAP